MANKFFKLPSINFDNPLKKFFLVAGTFLAAMIITLVVIAIRTNIFIALSLLVVFPISIIEFPTGLVSVFTGQYSYIPNEIVKTIIVILVYICISIFAVIAKKKVNFNVLYLLLLLLLIINIVGCSVSAPIRLSGIN